jgi:hypothetical protein
VVHVEVREARAHLAILALEPVAKHEVAPRQSDAKPRPSLVPREVQDPWNPQSAADDRNRLKVVAWRERAPELEVVELALVKGFGSTAVHQHERAPD